MLPLHSVLALAVKRNGSSAFLRSLRRSFHPLECHKQLTSGLRLSLNSIAANMSDKKQTVDLGLLEEDDEFEEFPAEGE